MDEHKVCLQCKILEAFKKWKYCMENIYPPSEENFLKFLIKISTNTIKDNFIHLRVNMGNHPNQRQITASAETSSLLNVWCIMIYASSTI